MNVNDYIVREVAEALSLVLGHGNVKRLRFESSLSQIRAFKPDLTLLIGSALPSVCDYRALALATRACGGIFAFWTVEDPYEFDMGYKFTSLSDLIFTNDLESLRYYDHNMVYHLPLAGSRTDLYETPGDYNVERPIDVFFCGVPFHSRQQFLIDAAPILEEYHCLFVGPGWPLVSSRMILNKRIDRSELMQYYRKSKLILNLGRDFHPANRRMIQPVTPGPRTFDAAMCGAAQLYFRPSFALGAYFERGREIVVCDTISELRSVLRKSLGSSEDMKRISINAQKRCLADHTYDARAAVILEHARNILAHTAV